MRTEEGRLVLLFSGKKLLLLVFHEMECSVTSFFFFLTLEFVLPLRLFL